MKPVRSTEPAPEHARAARPVTRLGHDLLDVGGDSLTRLERFHIRLARRTLEPGAIDRAMRWCQRNIGARWINWSIANLRHVYGLDRLPPLDASSSFLVVSNHRSFFDLHVVSSILVARGLPHRLTFPIRANFFYDNPLGIVVNGAMSFFAMYPPIFRDRARAAWNLASLDEVARLLRREGTLVGVHPEGARKKDDDPYTFLPAQSGVGRLIHKARVRVLPVFVNGLVNSIPEQIADNVTRRGTKVVVVFGKPVDFGSALDAPQSPRVYKRLSETALAAIGELGREEREIRASLG